MKALLLKIVIFMLIGLSALPFIGSSSPSYMYKDQVAVIMYHHLSDKDKSNVTITPKLFRDQLTYLKNHDYRFINLQQFEHYMAGGSVPDNAVLVTFDDGYKSFYDIAFPILTELNIPAVNFEITQNLANPNGGNLPYLSKEQIAEMTGVPDRGIDIQCHSDSFHGERDGQPLLTLKLSSNGVTESDEEYGKRVVADTQECRSKLSQLYNSPEDTYAYPFGSFDRKASGFIQQGGIHYAFTVVSEMATNQDDPMQIPRITAGNPSITPEELHQTIMRKAVDLNRKFGYVPFRDSVGQVGGTMIQDKDSTINFYYRGKHWMTQVDSSTVKIDDQSIQLSAPVKIKSRRAQIKCDDLQRVMGIHMVYNPITKKFMERLTPPKQNS